VQSVGRRSGAQRRSLRANQIAHRLLGSDARVARRAGAQMIFDRAAVGDGQFAVDERRHQWIERITFKH